MHTTAAFAWKRLSLLPDSKSSAFCAHGRVREADRGTQSSSRDRLGWGRCPDEIDDLKYDVVVTANEDVAGVVELCWVAN